MKVPALTPTVYVMRAFADDTRVAIIELTCSDRTREWTANELAAHLQIPVSTTYYHLRLLEEIGLIEVAGTRQIRSIVQKRYVAAEFQLTLRFGPVPAGTAAIQVETPPSKEVSP